MESTKETVLEICIKKGYKRENVPSTDKMYFTTPEKKQIKVDFKGNIIKFLSINGIVEDVLEISTFIYINPLN